MKRSPPIPRASRSEEPGTHNPFCVSPKRVIERASSLDNRVYGPRTCRLRANPGMGVW